jgi:hypothetical protein
VSDWYRGQERREERNEGWWLVQTRQQRPEEKNEGGVRDLFLSTEYLRRLYIISLPDADDEVHGHTTLSHVLPFP